MQISIVCLLIASLFFAASASVQKSTVKGTTICQSRRFTGVKVILKEHDTFDPDDDMGETVSDDRGDFLVTGQTSELTTIEPYIVFEHTCNAKPNCKRVTRYEYPKDKIDQTYNMDYVALDIVSATDKEVCP